MKQNYISLFSNCIIVQGYCRSAICDIQKDNYFPIPNSLSHIFKTDFVNISLLKNEYNENEIVIINEYIDYWCNWDHWF